MRIALLGLFALFAALALVLVFEIMMIVDAFKNPRLSDNERLLWIIGMILLHPIVAIVYYLVAHSRLS